jgi:hypothetical protein
LSLSRSCSLSVRLRFRGGSTTPSEDEKVADVGRLLFKVLARTEAAGERVKEDGDDRREAVSASFFLEVGDVEG